MIAGASAAAEPSAPAPVDEVVVNGRRPDACPPAAPVGGHGLDLACLDRQVKAAASAGRPPPLAGARDAAVRDAQVPSRAGTFSFSAVAQRMGPNLGKSAEPYRPPPPVYASPIAPRPPK